MAEFKKKSLAVNCLAETYIAIASRELIPVFYFNMTDQLEKCLITEAFDVTSCKTKLENKHVQSEWRTYTAHNERDGDNEAVEADDAHDGDPDQQIVRFIRFFLCSSSSSDSLRDFALVPWRNQAGHIHLIWSVVFFAGGGQQGRRGGGGLPSTSSRIPWLPLCVNFGGGRMTSTLHL